MSRASTFLATAGVVFLLGASSCSSGEASSSSSQDWKGQLESAVKDADRLVVGAMYVPKPVRQRTDGRERPTEQDSELRGRDKIAEFLNIIEIDAGKSGSHCKCRGKWAFRFYKGDKLVATIGFAHGDRLKWPDGTWSGDAHLTEACQVALPLWFKEAGYPQLQQARVDRLESERRQSEEDDLFASFFPAEAQPLVYGPLPDWTKRHREPEQAAGERIAEITGNPRLVAVAVCRAYGVSQHGMLGTASKERRALAAIATVPGPDLLAALEQLGDDSGGLLGAARLFFRGRLREVIPPSERVAWTVRLSEAVFDDGLDKERPLVLEHLATLDDPAIRSLLHAVASGEVGTERNLAEAREQEPSLRIGALLALAILEDKTIVEQVMALLPTVEWPQDRAALEVCMALSGDPAYLKAEHFSLKSRSIGLASLKAIEHFNGAYGMDVLVTRAVDHPSGRVSEEAVDTFDRITGLNMKDRRSWDTTWGDLIRAWWEANGESFVQHRRRSSGKPKTGE